MQVGEVQVAAGDQASKPIGIMMYSSHGFRELQGGRTATLQAATDLTDLTELSYGEAVRLHEGPQEWPFLFVGFLQESCH